MSKDNDLEDRVKLAQELLDRIATFNDHFAEIGAEGADRQAINTASEFSSSLSKIRGKILRRDALNPSDRDVLVNVEEFLKILGKI